MYNGPLKYSGTNPVGERSIVISVFVCLSVCLSAKISLEARDRSSPIFFALVARGRGSALLWPVAVRYVLPVLRMPSRFPIMYHIAAYSASVAAARCNVDRR